MKLAVIAPPQWPGVNDSLGYHFFLGQELIRDGTYYNMAERARKSGAFIIVDNGAAEPEEEREPFSAIVHAANGLLADEIIMPDRLRDNDWTRYHSENSSHLVPRRNRFIVPQGENWADWEQCLLYLARELEPATIGVAKWLEELPGGRVTALESIWKFGLYKQCNIHLLGIYGKPFEEVKRAVEVFPTIRGVDTGAPIAYAQHNRRLSDSCHYSLDWDRQDANLGMMYDNARDYARYCYEAPYKYGGLL